MNYPYYPEQPLEEYQYGYDYYSNPQKLKKDSFMVIIHILAHVHFILTLTHVLFITTPLLLPSSSSVLPTPSVLEIKEELSALLFCS